MLTRLDHLVILARDLRVPGGSATKHPNSATGISRLGISAPDPQRAANSLAALADTEDPVRLGARALSPVKARDEVAKGPGPSTVKLAGEGPETSLDPMLAHGAGLRLRARAG